MTEKNRLRSLSILLISVWLVLFVLIPNLMILVLSILTRDESQFYRWDYTWENYQRLFDPVYLQVFIHSLWMAVVTTLLCLLLAYPFAYFVAQAPKRWRNLLLLLVIIPFWTNSLIRTYAIKVILGTKGLLNTVLLELGLIETPLRLLYTETAVILGLTYLLLPFMILPLFAVLEKIDPNLNEAAADLGANAWKRFWRITVPLSLPGIIAGSLMVLLPALGMFYISDILGGAKNLVVGNIIKSQFLDARDWPFGSAASVTLTVVMALMLFAYYRVSRNQNRELIDR